MERIIFKTFTFIK